MAGASPPFSGPNCVTVDSKIPLSHDLRANRTLGAGPSIGDVFSADLCEPTQNITHNESVKEITDFLSIKSVEIFERKNVGLIIAE